VNPSSAGRAPYLSLILAPEADSPAAASPATLGDGSLA